MADSKPAAAEVDAVDAQSVAEMPEPQLGKVATVLASPLISLVVSWDAGKAVITRALPFAARAVTHRICSAVRFLAARLRTFVQVVRDALDSILNPLVRAWRSAFAAAPALAGRFVGLIRSAVVSIGQLLMRIMRAMRSTVVRFGRPLVAALRGVARRITVAVRAAFRAVVQSIRAGVQAVGELFAECLLGCVAQFEPR